MPIYEYRCTACGHDLEKLQRLGDAPLTECPACGKAKLRRLVSAAGFRLKGSGWYETDFKKDGKKNLHDSHGADKAPAAKKDAADGESAKPADSKKADSMKTGSNKADSTKTDGKKTDSSKAASGTAAAKPGAT
ncbi:MAG: FmdB family zinc ribbon protein [Lysobacterales bacterium]